MPGLAGYGGAVVFGAQASTPFTNEAMTETVTDTVFTVTDAARSMWDDTAAFVVQKDTAGNGTFITQPASGYTINHAIGRVTFAVAIGGSDIVRVSAGSFFTKTTVARAREWSLDVERQLEEDTELGSAWETFLPILGKGSGSVKLNWESGWFAQMMSTTPRIVLSLQVSTAAAQSYEFTALLSKNGINAGVKGLVDEEFTFQSVGPVNYLDR